MRTFVRVLVLTIGALGLLAASTAPSAADEGGNLTDFSSMTPVTGAAVGTVNDRGIKGGGLPWAITSGTGTVSHRGTVDVTVTGLVIPVLGNKNPVGMFKATLSCLGPEGVVNVSTGMLFVAAPGGQWFAESNPDTQP